MNIYKQVLFLTNSIYQNNDSKTRKPKLNQGEKWKSLISAFWNGEKKEKVNQSPTVQGSGLINCTENPIQYKYIDYLNELLKKEKISPLTNFDIIKEGYNDPPIRGHLCLDFIRSYKKYI